LLRWEGLVVVAAERVAVPARCGRAVDPQPEETRPAAQVPDASARRVAELETQLAQAQVRLKRAEALLDLQKSVGNPGSGTAQARRGALIAVALEAVDELSVAPVC